VNHAILYHAEYAVLLALDVCDVQNCHRASYNFMMYKIAKNGGRLSGVS